MIKNIIATFFILLLSACSNKLILEGHYHLLYNTTEKEYGVWNIKQNKIIFEDDSTDREDLLLPEIMFRGDSIFFPWDDIFFEARYKQEPNGVINMYTERDTLSLIPSDNCVKLKDYFLSKIKYFSNSFNLTSNLKTGNGELPSNYSNELIIGGKFNDPFYLFNGKILHDYDIDIHKVKNQDIWVYIDRNIEIKKVIPIVKVLFEKGYNINYASNSTYNDEQINLINCKIVKSTKTSSMIESYYCDYCDKYPIVQIDSTINIQVLDSVYSKINNIKIETYRLNNYISNFITQNRSTRLKSLIIIKIPGNLRFCNYLELFDNLKWTQYEVSNIQYYQGANDCDTTQIQNKQNNWKTKNEVTKEFPLRIKELIIID